MIFLMMDTLSSVSPVSIDPTPYTAWGVVGTLAFTIVVLCGTVIVILVRQSNRDRMLMDFVDRQRSETSLTLKDMSTTLQTSQDHLGTTLTTALNRFEQAFTSQSNRLNEVLVTGRVLERVAALQRRGEKLDDTVISQIVSAVKQQSSTT